MPRTFLNAILNRPSQSYAPPMPPDPTVAPPSAGKTNSKEGKATGKRLGDPNTWATPTDLPNAPQKPSSLLAQTPHHQHHTAPSHSRRQDSLSSSVQFSGPPSSAGGGSTLQSRSRFGLRKKQSRPAVTGSTFDDDGASSIYPESNATASQKKKRWWDTGSLRGFGKSSRSRAGSVAGDSIFSEPPERQGTQSGIAGIGSKATAPRATRSDFGGDRPPPASRHPPPLPENGAAMIRSMSGLNGKKGTGVTPLGQQSPSLAQSNVKRSKSDLRTASSPPPASSSSSVRRASALPRQSSNSDWNSFTQSMSERDVAKSWTRTPAKTVDAGPQRRHSVIDRVRRELEQDAQAEQVSRDPGILHEDLISRAAAAVLGPPIEEANLAHPTHLPSGLRPGSIVGNPTTAQDGQSSAQVDAEPTTAQRSSMESQDTAAQSAGQHQPGQPSQVPSQSAPVPPVTGTISQGSSQQESQSSGDEASSEEEGSGSSEGEEEEDSEHPALDVVAEEDEDGSSNGGHEMRAGPRSSYVPRSQIRHAAFDSAIGRMSFSSPTSPVMQASAGESPSLPTKQLPKQPSLLQSATESTPAISVHDVQVNDRQPHHTTEHPVSPSVPPKPLPSVDIHVANQQVPISTGGKIDDPPSSPQQAAKLTYLSSQAPSVSQSLKLQEGAGEAEASSASPTYDGVRGAAGPQKDRAGADAASLSTQTSSSDSDSDSDSEAPAETDEESGKDGEIDDPVREENVRGVKFERGHDSSEEDDSDEDEEREPGTPSSAARKGKAKADSVDGEEAETETAGSETTSTRTTQRSASIRSSRPVSMQRRLSDMSLGNSFAFSHFMGSKISGRSSSRRIRLEGDESDSAGEGSGEDEELKKLALAEQDRLRNMSVGDDFFGPSLNDVLAQFDKMDFSLPDDEAMKAIAEKAQADGTTQEESAKAQKDAQFIVSEVRRRRAAGDKDNDGKTLQSEAGGLAASFAALWLLNQAPDEVSSATKVQPPASPPKEPISFSTSRFEFSASPSKSNNAPPAVLDASSILPRSTSVMNRPRQRAERPQEMGGIAISKGKLPAEATQAPSDERSTLPSLPSFTSFSPPGSPTSTLRQSVDLGDQKRSKDKPPPSKSALKPKSIRHSKSLADTLFSFGPKTQAKGLNDKKEKRTRSNSVTSKTSKKSHSSDHQSDEEKQLNGKKSLDTIRSFTSAKNRTAKGKSKSQDIERAKILDTTSSKTESQPSEQADIEARQSSSTGVSPVKEAGEPEYHRRQASHASSTTDSEGHMPTSRYVTAEDLASQAEKRSPSKNPASPRRHQQQRSESSTSDAGQQVEAMSDRSEHQVTNAVQPDGDNLEEEKSQTSAASRSSVDASQDSMREHLGQEASIEEPSTDAVVSAESQKTKILDMPPRPDFNEGVASTLATPGSDRTPLAREHQQPTFGMAIIPPTPPATDAKSKVSPDQDQKTPTAEVSSPLVSALADGPILARSPSSASKSKRHSSRKSAASPVADSHGLVLPNGLTATTVASSNSIKRKKSKKSSSSGNNTKAEATPTTGDKGGAPPMPISAAANIALATATIPVTENLLTGPELPPKDAPSRRYSQLPDLGAAKTKMTSVSLSSLSPPSTAPSSTGTPDPDVSPSRSVSGASSSVASSVTSSTSNLAVSDMSDNHQAARTQHRARVRTQSAGPSRRPSVMSSISEWDHSPMSGQASPVSPLSPRTGPAFESFTPSSATRSNSSVVSGLSPELVRNAPMGSSTEAYLQPPVPRSRLTAEERQRQAFEAQLDAAGYSRSEGGQGAAAASLSRQNSLSGAIAHSVDGHGGLTPSGRPQSIMSSFSTVSVPHSMSSLPSVPMSSYRPTKDPVKAAGSSTVDERLYQRSTMATISVASGAFAKSSKGTLSRRKSSLDSSLPASDGVTRRSGEHVPEHLQDELGLTQMALTAHTAPPRKIGSKQVLVQVIAVSIDEMDRMLLRDKIRSGDAYGWVPGRSFCGRVMEVGWEIKRLRKGDMVFGLQSNRRCGGLAEFMTVDEEYVAKAPEDCLTVEQIAALPSTGVLALQIVRNYCTALPRGARILILNAHDGIGLLSMQECADLGLIMVAQCPASISDGLAVCEANGAHEVVIGEPLWAINTLHESSFDLVVDTIGGRRLYDASRRILASNGQFVTCFGDEHSSANPNFKSHMRSLRRSFFKKDKKNIGYEWIGLENPEDTKECLEAVRNAAERGDICPRLSSVLPFPDAPRAFDPVIRGVEETPGAVVVRVS
ncbi:unnamed protein product [Sympodiomycopsis kandeliae]